MAQLPDDYQDGINIKNGFQCSECLCTHDITDVFLWSSCQHKYSRGCVVFVIKQQLYDKKLPICIVDNCNKLLLEDAAQLVLPHDILMEFYQTHNDYQYPQNQTKLAVDEKNSLPHYESLKQPNDSDNTSNSDGFPEIEQQIFGTIDADPEDDSSDAEITYDKTEQEPLLKHQPSYGTNMNMNMSVNTTLFDCIVCDDKHFNYDKFAWTQCRHLYGRQCAENMIIEWLFKRDIPQCIKCKSRLEVFDATSLLQVDELQIFKQIYALKASLVSFNAEQQQNKADKDDNDDNADMMSSEKTSIQDRIVAKSDNTDNAPIASVSDQTEKLSKHKEIESKQTDVYENKEDEYKDNKLMPSVLMLPDNNYQALIPMDDDFIDEKGIILNSKKELELKHKNLFYCSRCKKLISLLDDENNGKYTPIKCKHVSCKQCAKKHTKHEMEVLQFIPSCQVCGKSIVDNDLVNIWGQNQANTLMAALFKEKSLQLPPAEPALAGAPQPNIVVAGAENAENAGNAENDAGNAELEQKVVENENEDGFGHCMTESCHKKGLLSREKHEEARLDCIGCGISWCVRCGVAWHLGQTCKQYENEGVDDIDIIYALQQQEAMQFDNNYDDILNGYYDKNEQEFQNLYQEQGWKTCPVCNSVVEKDGGCNRIQCAQCTVSFCWCCVQIVDENGNDKHYEIGKCPLNEEIINNDAAGQN